MTTFKISEFKNVDFEKKMNKFTKRAKKLGLDFGFELVSTSQETYSSNGKKFFYNVFEYSVWGDAPVINGYEFIAKIENVSDGVTGLAPGPLARQAKLGVGHQKRGLRGREMPASCTKLDFVHDVFCEFTHTVKNNNIKARVARFPREDCIMKQYEFLAGGLRT